MGGWREGRGRRVEGEEERGKGQGVLDGEGLEG